MEGGRVRDAVLSRLKLVVFGVCGFDEIRVKLSIFIIFSHVLPEKILKHNVMGSKPSRREVTME